MERSPRARAERTREDASRPPVSPRNLRRFKRRPVGFTSAEAQHRLEKYGLNEIKAHEESAWHKLLQYFWGPIPWMIEIAAIISLARQDWADFGVIMGLLLYNAAIGFWQDNKAASALAALKKSLAHQARVLRNGRWTVVEATDLVPGDIVSINAGDPSRRSGADRRRISQR